MKPIRLFYWRLVLLAALTKARIMQMTGWGRQRLAYIVPLSSGFVAALLITPTGAGNEHSLFSFSMTGAMSDMMVMAETMFNGLVGAFANIWGIALGIGLLMIVSAAIFAVVRVKSAGR